jgi:hypothetical protein
MYRVSRGAVVWLLVALVVCPPAFAQTVVGPDVWRSLAENLEPGKVLKVRMRNGQRFKATLLQVTPEAMTVQPKTRAAVPPQQVRFDAIETLDVENGKGVSIGKAVAVGAGVAAGVWLAMMAFAFAVWGD